MISNSLSRSSLGFGLRHRNGEWKRFHGTDRFQLIGTGNVVVVDAVVGNT